MLYALEQTRIGAWLYQSDYAMTSHPHHNERALEIDGRVAVIYIVGGLVADLNQALTTWRCVTSYTHVQHQLAQARAKHADGLIDQILLVFDSPGGNAAGMDDCARAIAEVDVPVTAYVRGTACSAAMYLAVAADRVVASAMAVVGSIGAVYHAAGDPTHVGTKQVKKTIRSPETPEKALGVEDPGFDEQMVAVTQAATEAILNWVASRRGLTGDLPSATGKGAVLSAKRALSMQLIDAIGPRADALAPTTEDDMTEEEQKKYDAAIEAVEKANEEIEALKKKLDAMDKADDEANVEARIRVALDAMQSKFDGELATVRADSEARALKAEATAEFERMLARRTVSETDRSRFMRDHRLATQADATDEDKAILAEWGNRQPLAPTERTSHGHTAAGDDPFSPANIQAHADKHHDGDYTAALIELSTRG